MKYKSIKAIVRNLENLKEDLADAIYKQVLQMTLDYSEAHPANTVEFIHRMGLAMFCERGLNGNIICEPEEGQELIDMMYSYGDRFGIDAVPTFLIEAKAGKIIKTED